MKTETYIKLIYGLFGASLGVILGAYLTLPKKVVIGDFNDDGHPDVAISSPLGEEPYAIFLGQEDGRLELLTDTKKKMREDIEAQINKIKTSVLKLETNVKPEATQGLEGK